MIAACTTLDQMVEGNQATVFCRIPCSGNQKNAEDHIDTADHLQIQRALDHARPSPKATRGQADRSARRQFRKQPARVSDSALQSRCSSLPPITSEPGKLSVASDLMCAENPQLRGVPRCPLWVKLGSGIALALNHHPEERKFFREIIGSRVVHGHWSLVPSDGPQSPKSRAESTVR